MSNESKNLPAQTDQVATNSLTIGRATGGLLPQSLEDLWRLGGMMYSSGMMPTSLKSREAVCVAIQMGLEVGLSPMQAVQNIAVINGRPTVWGDAMLGLVQGSGLLEDFSEVQIQDGGGGFRCTAKRKGNPTPIVRTFTQESAKKAGLWGKQGPWQQYPDRMLQMRARSFALRDGFSDVLKGLIAREEARDLPPVETDFEDVTPPPPPNGTVLEVQPPQAETTSAPAAEDKAPAAASGAQVEASW